MTVAIALVSCRVKARDNSNQSSCFVELLAKKHQYLFMRACAVRLSFVHLEGAFFLPAVLSRRFTFCVSMWVKGSSCQLQAQQRGIVVQN